MYNQSTFWNKNSMGKRYQNYESIQSWEKKNNYLNKNWEYYL